MCQRCEELEERVAWLESELGLQRAADVFAKIRAAMPAVVHGNLRGRATGLVTALYKAEGRTMTSYQIMEALPALSGIDERDPGIVKVWVCAARKTLGRDSIETVWGRGYRMTPAGLARVKAILEPERAAA